MPEEDVLTALDDAGLHSVLERAGGLDVEHDWLAVLSLGEQQQLAVTRAILARPAFAILDRLDSVLNPTQGRRSLKLLAENGISCVMFADLPSWSNCTTQFWRSKPMACGVGRIDPPLRAILPV